MKTNTRIVHTGLYGDVSAEILDSVLGQESDGAWENTPSHAKFWCFARIKRAEDGEVLIEVSDGYDDYHHVESFFTGKDDFEVKKYFANRIKLLTKMEHEACHIMNGWRRDCDFKLCYLGDCHVSEAYLTYEVLKGRSRAPAKYSAATVDVVIRHAMTPEDLKRKKAIEEINAEKEEHLKLAEEEFKTNCEKIKAIAEAKIASLNAA